MKNTLRSLFALLLAVLTLCSLSAAAFAEDPDYTYADGQIYQADDSQVFVYTVQVSAGPQLAGAERVRSEMLAAGFDGFLYETDCGYRIMCGKFLYREDAMRYRNLIREKTLRKKAYVTDACLPQSALDDFAASYKQDPLVASVFFRGWEDPSGPFVDLAMNEKETELVYAVLYGSGVNFSGAERSRDLLIEKGFDAYVVRMPGLYLILAGSFDNKDDAKALRDQIREATGRMDPCVREISLPKA